jgi:hypothetical protein
MFIPNKRTNKNDVLVGIGHIRKFGGNIEGDPKHHKWITFEEFCALPCSNYFELREFAGGQRAYYKSATANQVQNNVASNNEVPVLS